MCVVFCLSAPAARYSCFSSVSNSGCDPLLVFTTQPLADGEPLRLWIATNFETGLCSISTKGETAAASLRHER